MLSEENRKKINPRGLYKHEVVRSWVHTSDPYWCRNWTFKPHLFDDGRVFMYDSYYDSWDSSIEVTDENFNEWEFIFDIDEVRRISYDESEEYKDEDLYKCIAIDSGGYSCSSCIWVNKNTKKDIDKQIDKAQRRLDSALFEVQWRRDDLEKLKKEKQKID